MPGRIRQSDIDEVKARINIADVIGDYVALKPAGVGSLKGLCPFHDERSPSFHVRPQLGYYHCFGCGESGDAISFLQAMDHVTFAEAIERLAARVGFTLTYEEGGEKDAAERGNRARLLAANSAAEQFFIERLSAPDADPGRRFLGERAFDAAAAAHFGVGYAPKGWDELTNHLRGRGFSYEELTAAGLASQGDRTPYDRFRGRVVWPIRDVTGQTVGFGARRLFDDDNGPKYLNTPETPVYRKNQVLYGLDIAKRDIARSRTIVIVEGYTDVMACHLAGVTTAVATCGTAFGTEHVRVLRRVLGDDSSAGQVIFTFDPDAAGQKAAERSFAVLHEQRIAAQSYVAVGPDGLDPCDLRLAQGDAAVQRMIDTKKPMFEFMLRQLVAKYDLDTVEGRVAALREAAPVVAEIRDPALRPGYTRELARIAGAELREAEAAVRSAARAPQGQRALSQAPVPGAPAQPQSPSRSDQTGPTLAQLGSDPVTRLESEALMAVLQHPQLVGDELVAQLPEARFNTPAFGVVRDAIAANLDSVTAPGWFDRVLTDTPGPLQTLVRQLGVTPLPARDDAAVPAYVRGAVAALAEKDLVSRKGEVQSRLLRADPSDRDAYQALQRQLLDLELRRRKLRGE